MLARIPDQRPGLHAQPRKQVKDLPVEREILAGIEGEGAHRRNALGGGGRLDVQLRIRRKHAHQGKRLLLRQPILDPGQGRLPVARDFVYHQLYSAAVNTAGLVQIAEIGGKQIPDGGAGCGRRSLTGNQAADFDEASAQTGVQKLAQAFQVGQQVVQILLGHGVKRHGRIAGFAARVDAGFEVVLEVGLVKGAVRQAAGVDVAVRFDQVFPGNVGGDQSAFRTTGAVMAMAAAAGGGLAGKFLLFFAEKGRDGLSGGAGAAEVDLLAARFRGTHCGGPGRRRRKEHKNRHKKACHKGDVFFCQVRQFINGRSVPGLREDPEVG